MKKLMAGILTISMLLTMLALPAMAEGTGTTTNTNSMTTIMAKGGPQSGGNGQNQMNGKGQMPGGGQRQNGSMGQAPDMNSQNGSMGQAPDMNSQSTPKGEAPNDNQNADENNLPAMPEGNVKAGSDEQSTPTDTQNTQTFGKDMKNGKQNGRNGGKEKGQKASPTTDRQTPGEENGQSSGMLNLSTLVEKNIIDQDTADKIEAYLKENTPELPEDGQNPADGTTPPEKPADDNGTTPPEKPADDNGTTPPEKPADDNGTTPSELPTMGDMQPQDDLLTKLVEAGILTQDQADAISALMVAPQSQTANADETAEIG